MKRFLRPAGHLLTTAVFTSVALDTGHLKAQTVVVPPEDPSTAPSSDSDAPATPAPPVEVGTVAPPEAVSVQSPAPPPPSSVAKRAKVEPAVQPAPPPEAAPVRVVSPPSRFSPKNPPHQEASASVASPRDIEAAFPQRQSTDPAPAESESVIAVPASVEELARETVEEVAAEAQVSPDQPDQASFSESTASTLLEDDHSGEERLPNPAITADVTDELGSLVAPVPQAKVKLDWIVEESDDGAIADEPQDIDESPIVAVREKLVKNTELQRSLVVAAIKYAQAGQLDRARLIAQDPLLPPRLQERLQAQIARFEAEPVAQQPTKPDSISSAVTPDRSVDPLPSHHQVPVRLPVQRLSPPELSSVQFSPSRCFEFGSTSTSAAQTQLTPATTRLASTSATPSAAMATDAPAAKKTTAPAPTARSASISNSTIGSKAAQTDWKVRHDLRLARFAPPSTLIESDRTPSQYYQAAIPDSSPTPSFTQSSSVSFAALTTSDLEYSVLAGVAFMREISQRSLPSEKQPQIQEQENKDQDLESANAQASTEPQQSLQAQPNAVTLRQTVNCFQPDGNGLGRFVLATRPLGPFGMAFPLSIPAQITSLFGWRIHPITGDQRFHAGTDFGAPMGTPVVAAMSGQVAFADFMGGYGATVILEHPETGQRTLYAHLSQITVQSGTWVERGTVIGRVGSTGNSTGPHLHFEVRQFTTGGWIPTNPLLSLRSE